MIGWLLVIVFNAGMAYANYQRYETRVSTAESDIKNIKHIDVQRDKKLTRMDYNVQMIAKKVGAQYIEPEHDEMAADHE